jgi:hypothetical protein
MPAKLIIGASLFFASLFLISDLNGSWKGKVKTPNGNEADLTYVFKVDGEKLTGSVISQWGEHPIIDGKVKGDEYSFNQTYEDLKIMHSGKVTGDSLFVKIELADNPAMEATFVRSK